MLVMTWTPSREKLTELLRALPDGELLLDELPIADDSEEHERKVWEVRR